MKKSWAFVLAIVLALACALGVSALVHRSSQRPSPNIDGLRENLKQAAEKRLSAPSIANEQILVTVPSERMETRAREIIDAAIQAGGTAIKTANADGTATVLAQIPGHNAEFFRALMNKEE